MTDTEIVSLSRPTERTKLRLYAMSRNQCAFTGCENPVVHDETGTLLTEVCHICGDKPGSARYEKSQTDAERHGYSNLILLCRNHHKVIDDNPNQYTRALLEEMKRKHESVAKTREFNHFLVLTHSRNNRTGEIEKMAVRRSECRNFGPIVVPPDLSDLGSDWLIGQLHDDRKLTMYFAPNHDTDGLWMVVDESEGTGVLVNLHQRDRLRQPSTTTTTSTPIAIPAHSEVIRNQSNRSVLSITRIEYELGGIWLKEKEDATVNVTVHIRNDSLKSTSQWGLRVTKLATDSPWQLVATGQSLLDKHMLRGQPQQLLPTEEAMVSFTVRLEGEESSMEFIRDSWKAFSLSLTAISEDFVGREVHFGFKEEGDAWSSTEPQRLCRMIEERVKERQRMQEKLLASLPEFQKKMEDVQLDLNRQVNWLRNPPRPQ